MTTTFSGTDLRDQDAKITNAALHSTTITQVYSCPSVRAERERELLTTSMRERDCVAMLTTGGIVFLTKLTVSVAPSQQDNVAHN